MDTEPNFGINTALINPHIQGFPTLLPPTFSTLTNLAAQREAQLEKLIDDHHEFSLGASITLQRKASQPPPFIGLAACPPSVH